MIPMGLQSRTRNPRRVLASTPVSSWTYFSSTAPTLWLDASDSSTITHTSNAVSEWRDKSGNGLHVSQATSTAQPTTNTATQNGLNVLVFDGGDLLSNSLNTNINVGNVSAYVVFKETTRVSNAGVISLHTTTGDDNNNARSLNIETGNGNYFCGAVRANAYGRVGGSALSPWGVYAAMYQTGGINQMFLDNVKGTAETVTNGAFGIADAGVVIGGRFFTSKLLATNRLNGQIGEVIIYPRSHSDLERRAIQNYLKAKWGTP